MSLKASGKLVALSRPSLGPEEEQAVIRVLRSGRLVAGPEGEAFEDEFAGLTGSRYAIAVSSGTTALFLALLALDIGSGDQVVVPAYSFIATANAAKTAGAEVVLADVELSSMNLDPASLARAINSQTAVVMPVHQFGLPANLEAIAQVAAQADLVEDAACAAGAQIKSQPIGRPHGRLACFSFHPRKVVTTGEGGMITTNDELLAERLRALRQHGFSHERAELPGFNFRLSEIAAAQGRVQLERLPDLLSKRKSVARQYQECLAGLDWLGLPPDENDERHTFQSYVVRLKSGAPGTREQFMTHLKNT
ncbi:MAG: DegT/DnrJ/EryC1/StrS family aminotransferase, partial [Deltaproteobacteria bacterium]|nr:DegT/DnrJ/EryC1/StrS family aminotransferase [Deltaproteobacteria bacterium]